MKKRLVIIPVVAILAISSVAYFGITRKGQPKTELVQATVSVNKIDERYSISSDKDGFLGTYYGDSATINVTYGKHNITVSSSDYDSSSSEVNIVGIGQTIKIELKKKTALNKSIELINDKTTAVSLARYFGEDTWMLSYLQYDEPNSNAEIIIFKKIGDEWKQVIQGSAIDVDYLKYKGAPSDLINYLENR